MLYRCHMLQVSNSLLLTGGSRIFYDGAESKHISLWKCASIAKNAFSLESPWLYLLYELVRIFY